MRIYRSSYVINDIYKQEELNRLSDKCEASIYFLRKAAPKFYRDKLPALIDQVANILLGFDLQTEEGQAKVHTTHACFLMILVDLRRSQPAGEFDFDTETRRIRERGRHLERYKHLSNKIAELEAIEFEPDELGDDDKVEDKYTQVFHELEKCRADLTRTALEIAYLDGEDLEPSVEFKLYVGKNQMLSKLNSRQLDLLEMQLAELYKKNYKRRDAFVDRSTFDDMIERLNIDQSQFKKVDISDMAVEALGAYNSYRRQDEQERSNEYFQRLLDKEQLRPKEGEILDDPDSIPSEMRATLDDNDQACSRKMQHLFREFGEKPNSEELSGADQMDDGQDDGGDGMDEIIQAIKNSGREFARVKEEIPDDIEIGEMLLGESQDEPGAEPPPGSGQEPNLNTAPTTTTTTVGCGKPDGISVGVNTIGQAPSGEGDSDSDDIMCLGTIEPGDKIKTISIDC